jgi:hypothetical protein
MYGYADDVNFTTQQILEYVKQEDIFSFVFNDTIDINSKYISPFREDKTRGCWFEWYDGTLLFMDFGDKIRHRSCFRAVMDKYNVDMSNALKIISNQFNLTSTTVKISPVKKYSANVITTKQSVNIDFTNRSFEKKDISYWSQFLITKDNLIEDDVHPVLRFVIDSKGSKKVITPYNICYSYPFNEKVKLYMPLNESDFKWITNTDENDVGNLHKIDSFGKKLIITKSYKDHRVLKNLGYNNVVWFQNEACVPNRRICTDLISRFKNIHILYDNDQQGFTGSNKIVSLFNSVRNNSTKALFLPKEFNWKDPAEFIRKEGKETLLQVLKQIGL